MKNYKIIIEKIRSVKIIGLVLLLMAAVNSGCEKSENEPEPWELELAQLINALEPFKDFEAAQAAGYDIQATEYRIGMGYHFLNAGLLDETFDATKPEVLIFINDPSGKMKLVAVEYGIPIADVNHPPPPPEGFSGKDDVWEISEEFNLWTLHAWVVMENPDGVFAPMNPMLP